MDKVSLKNPKDQNFESYMDKVYGLLEKKAANLFKDKTFHVEFKGVFIASTALKAISNLASFFTSFVSVQIATNLVFGHYLSMFLAFSICLGLEVVKVFFWRINSKWIMKYRRISRGVLGVLVCLHCFSLGLSAYGGYMLPILVRPGLSVAPGSFDSKEVAHPYEVKIGKIDSLIALNAAKIASTSSNSTVKSLNKVAASLLEQKDYQEKAKNRAILRDRSEYDKKEAQKAENAKKSQILDDKRVFVAQLSCLAASIFFELMFIFSSIFCGYYLFRLNIELEAEDEDVPSTMSDVSPSIQQSKSEESSPTEPSIQPNKEEPQEARSVGFKSSAKECILSSCSKSFISAVHNKKYCSDNCRKLAYHQRKYSQTSKN